MFKIDCKVRFFFPLEFIIITNIYRLGHKIKSDKYSPHFSNQNYINLIKIVEQNFDKLNEYGKQYLIAIELHFYNKRIIGRTVLH